MPETKKYGIKSVSKVKTTFLNEYGRRPLLELEQPLDLFIFRKLAEEDGFSVELDSLEGSSGKAEIYEKIPRKYLTNILGKTKYKPIAIVDNEKIAYNPEAIQIIQKYGKEKLGWKEEEVRDLDFILRGYC